MWDASHKMQIGCAANIYRIIAAFHGESKMADTLPKGYEPHDVEARWRKHWEDDKTFTPDPDAPGEPYSIVKLESGVSLKIDEVKAVIEVRRQFEDWVRSKAINAEDYTDAAPVEVKVDATADDGSTAQDIPF